MMVKMLPEKTAKNSKSRVDLHMHSSCSDGDCSPQDVVRIAYEEGTNTIAITDHDTVSGLEEALAEGGKVGVEVMPGVEITARNDCTTHILGYFPGKSLADIIGIEDALKPTQEGRTERTHQQLSMLQQKGYGITKEEVEAYRRGVFTSKIHVIKVMIDKGYVATHKEGIELLESGQYDVPYGQWVVKPEDAIKLINSYGGIAVLAHPGKLMKKLEVEQFVRDLVKAGLRGMEVYSTKHSKKQTSYLSEIADKYNLIKTYGTDFHRQDSIQKIGEIEGADVDTVALLSDLKDTV